MPTPDQRYTDVHQLRAALYRIVGRLSPAAARRSEADVIRASAAVAQAERLIERALAALTYPQSEEDALREDLAKWVR